MRTYPIVANDRSFLQRLFESPCLTESKLDLVFRLLNKRFAWGNAACRSNHMLLHVFSFLSYNVSLPPIKRGVSSRGTFHVIKTLKRRGAIVRFPALSSEHRYN